MKKLLLFILTCTANVALLGMDAVPRAAISSSSSSLSSGTVTVKFTDGERFTFSTHLSGIIHEMIRDFDSNTAEIVYGWDFDEQNAKLLFRALEIFSNTLLAPATLKESLLTHFKTLTVENLLNILIAIDFFDVQNTDFNTIFLNYLTPYIFDVTKLDYLSNDRVCSLLQNHALKNPLIQQCLKQIPGLSYWIYQLPWQAKTLTGNYSVWSVAISSCGNFIVSGSWDGTIRIWDRTSGQCLKTLTGHTAGVMFVTISPCGNFIVSVSYDDEIRTWSLTSGQCLKTLTGHTTTVYSDAISPCGNFILFGSEDGKIRIRSLTSGQCLQILTGHTTGVRFVTISPCGKFFASGSWEDNSIKIWSINTDILNSLTIENVLFLIHVYNCIQNNQSIQTNTLHPALIIGMLTLPDALKNILPDNVKRDIEAYHEQCKKLYEDAGLNVVD